MLVVNETIAIPDEELDCQYIRSQGPGGQHVNKTATAVQLRFDCRNSPSLPDWCKERLLACRDHRISQDGIIVIKAQRYRSQDQNREDARNRLVGLIAKAAAPVKKRRPTKPTAGSRQRRLTAKSRDGRIKKLRGKIEKEE